MLSQADLLDAAQRIAAEPDRETRGFYVRVLADMVEEAGDIEEAGILRLRLDAGDEPRDVVAWYDRYTRSPGSCVQRIAAEHDREARVFHARVFAERVEEAGRLEEADLIRRRLDAGSEPRDVVVWYLRTVLKGCTEPTSGGPYMEFRNGLCWSVSFCGLAVRTLDPLRDMPYVRHLDVSRTAIKDDALACLDDMVGLESFVADSTRIGDQTIKRLSRLPRLAVLSIDNTRVTEASVDLVARMNLRLRHWPLYHLDLSSRRTGAS